jgi:hypothetical protein
MMLIQPFNHLFAFFPVAFRRPCAMVGDRWPAAAEAGKTILVTTKKSRTDKKMQIAKFTPQTLVDCEFASIHLEFNLPFQILFITLSQFSGYMLAIQTPCNFLYT